MLSYKTQGYSGFGAKYSPFFDNKIAVAASSNYGVVGNGRLYILSILPSGQIVRDIAFDTQDGLFDLSWSEIHENHIAVASGDGSVKLFDMKVPQYPILVFKEHTKEVFSTNWGLVDKTKVVSSSWDGTVKVWQIDGGRSNNSLITLHSSHRQQSKPVSQQFHLPNEKGNSDNTNCVYQAKFSPHDPSIIASVNAQSRLQIWDIRSGHSLQVDLVCHSGLEALLVDFNKYNKHILATSGVDKAVRVWDLRMIKNATNGSMESINPLSQHTLHHSFKSNQPKNQLMGHNLAIRNVVWSPHFSDELLTCSYDMTSRIFSDATIKNPNVPTRNISGCLNVFSKHTEFVMGGDWSLWGQPGWVVTTGWDEMVYVWNSKRRY